MLKEKKNIQAPWHDFQDLEVHDRLLLFNHLSHPSPSPIVPHTATHLGLTGTFRTAVFTWSIDI